MNYSALLLAFFVGVACAEWEASLEGQTLAHYDDLRGRVDGNFNEAQRSYGAKRLIQYLVPPGSSRVEQSEPEEDSAPGADQSVKIGSPCTTNADCADVNGAHCPQLKTGDSTCTCVEGKVSLAGLYCIHRATTLGGPCTVSAQCRALSRFAVCYNDRCLCEPHYYVAQRACQPVVNSLGYPIGSVPIFDPTPTVQAVPTIACERKRKLGMECCADEQCAYKVWNSRCVNEGGGRQRCRCDENYVPVGDTACARVATGLGQACSIDAQCNFDAGSECKTNNRCWCRDGFVPRVVPRGGRQDAAAVTACLPVRRLTQSCEDSRQCSAFNPDSECSEAVCRCREGFWRIDDENCVSLATQLGDRCSVDPQCRDIPFSECKAGGYCWCNDDTAAIDPPSGDVQVTRRRRQTTAGRCLPHLDLDERCEDNAQCSGRTANSECVGSNPNRCACQEGFCQRQTGVNECLPEISVLGDDTCTVNKQCITANAICDSDTDQCQCNAATHCEVANACQPYAVIGAECAGDCQCNTAGATCSLGECTCSGSQRHDVLTNACVDYTLAFADPFSFGGQFCCTPAAFTDAQFVGQANPGLDTTATITSIISANADFTSENDGTIYRVAGAAALNAPLTVTFTATADGGTGTLTTDFDVLLVPDACCTVAPTNPVTSASVIVNGNGPGVAPCAGSPVPIFAVDLGGNSILQGQLNALSASPPMTVATNFFDNLGCDETLTLTDVTFTNGPGLICSLAITDLLLAQHPANLMAQPGLTCTIAGTVASCNGLTAPFSIALTYFCSNS